MRRRAAPPVALTLAGALAGLLFGVPAQAESERAAPRAGSPSASVGCTAEIRVTNAWPGWFTIEVTIHSGAMAAVGGWAARFTLGEDMVVRQVWNGEADIDGREVTVRGSAWDGVPPPNGFTVGMGIGGDPTGWSPNPVCTAG